MVLNNRLGTPAALPVFWPSRIRTTVSPQPHRTAFGQADGSMQVLYMRIAQSISGYSSRERLHDQRGNATRLDVFVSNGGQGRIKIVVRTTLNIPME